MITGYVELATDAEVDAFEIELGRRFAAARGLSYPMPPEVVGAGKWPLGLARPTPYAQLTVEQKTLLVRRCPGALQTRYKSALRYYDAQARKVAVGGVFELDETCDVLGMPPGTVRKTKAQLSARARARCDQAEAGRGRR